jgi:hypothetical protein
MEKYKKTVILCYTPSSEPSECKYLFVYIFEFTYLIITFWALSKHVNEQRTELNSESYL